LDATHEDNNCKNSHFAKEAMKLHRSLPWVRSISEKLSFEIERITNRPPVFRTLALTTRLIASRYKGNKMICARGKSIQNRVENLANVQV
jgi:hypothetical protein